MKFSPELYRWIVTSSSDGLWIMDPAGTVQFANPRMAAILGRPLDDIVGMPAADMYDEDGRRDFRSHLRRLETAETGRDHLEVLVVRPDGSRVWTSSSFYPYTDDTGHRVGWVHRMTEFTALKDLNEKLRRSEAQLAEAQRIARIGSWEWDMASDVLTWSEELYRMLEVTAETCPATFGAYLGFVHPDDRAIAEESVAKFFTGEKGRSFDVRMLPTGGGEIWVRGTGYLERDDDRVPLRLVGTAQDVTVAKRVEEAEVRAAVRTRILQTMAAAANEATSLEQALVAGADELAEAVGWRLDAVYLVVDGELVRMADLGTARADTDPGLAQAAYRDRRPRTEPEPEPADPAHPDPTRVAIPVLLRGAVVCVVELDGVLGVGDTELVSTLDQALDQLGRVAEREQQAAAVAAARDEALEASRLKSEFLSTMSHEIRTPMNGVIGLTDLLRRTGLDPDQRRLVDGLHGTGQTLLHLINDILDLSKIEAGRLELELVDFDLGALFDQIAVVLAEPARSKGLQLSMSAEVEVPRQLHGDPGRLAQVLVNLGSNAVKFTDRGTVTVHASVPADDPSAVRFEVVDTGVGIAPQQRDRLFEAFVQADPSTTRRHGGTGLGLAICRQLVTAMGGQIGVTGRPGDGSTFWFTLPITAGGSARADGTPWSTPTADLAPAPPTTRARWHGRSVLVAEDNPVNQIVARGLLEVLGFSVDVVGDGEAAVAAATGPHAYDVVLMDCRMPRLDGYDATRQIRAREPAGRRLPIIALSASALAGERARCLAAGMDDFVPKPVELDRLDETLARWLPSAEEPVADPPADREDEPRPRRTSASPWLAVDRVDRNRQAVLASLVADGRSLLELATARFVVDAPSLEKDVSRAIAGGDAAALEAAAHKLRGSAANLGLARVALLARLLEERAEEAQLGADPVGDGTLLVDPIVVEALVDALRQELAELPAASVELQHTPSR